MIIEDEGDANKVIYFVDIEIINLFLLFQLYVPSTNVILKLPST